MSFELIGLLLSVCALVALFYSRTSTLAVLCVALLFQASAAITLHAMGGSPIPPGYLMIVFLGLAVLVRAGGPGRVLETLSFGRAEYILILFIAWAIITALFMPRIFQGMFEVYPLGTDTTRGLFRQPIAPLTSNIAQSVYYVGDLAVFIIVGAMLLSMRTLRPIALAVLISAFFNIAFVFVDTAAYLTGTGNLLSFVRNADVIHRAEDVVLGMKRVTGFFPETSSYSIHAMGLFAFTFRLWRGGVSLPYTGAIALATFISLILSTSSTAYAALAIYLMIVMPRDFSGIDSSLPNDRGRVGRTGLLLSLIPVGGVLAAIAIAVRPDLLDPINNMINEMLINKLDSDSGVERMNWNMLALQNVLDTYGLGVGVGSNRNSSFVIALVSSTGIIGTLLFVLFILKVFRTNHGRVIRSPGGLEDVQIAAAARTGMIALVIANSLSGATSLGLMFFILAAMASYRIIDNRSVIRGDPVSLEPDKGRQVPKFG